MFASRVFADRSTAGAALARKLLKQHFQPPVVVLGLPRGGVPVAYEVARRMHAPLDVMLVRKVGMPGQPELAIGAIATGNIAIREPQMAAQIPDFDSLFERLAREQRHELDRRERVYRAGRPPLELHGKTVILVDDGLATGSTMLAAVRAARKAGAATIVAAAPVASAEAAQLLAAEAGHVIILQVPREMFAIGSWYEDFEQLDDTVVCELLARSGKRPAMC
jgi:putative phosphoribosyl transferase